MTPILRPCFALGLAVAAACSPKPAAHDHAEAHPAGHDHHEEGHGHGGADVHAITRWSERYELFAEHEAAVAGQELSLLAHLTVLEDFGPLDRGEVSLELSGPAELRAVTAKPERPGIYRLSVTPTVAGEYTARVRIAGPPQDVIEGIRIDVAASGAHEDDHAHEAEDAHAQGAIELLKEQQWGVPFSTAFVREGTLAPSIEVAGRVATPPSGSAEVGAPVSGRIVPPTGGLPRPGTVVRKGQLLASLLPTPSSPEDAARVQLAIAETQARAAAAKTQLERAERLIQDQAISQRELEEARREASVAEQAVGAAGEAAALYASASSASGGGQWRMVAPIDGTLTEVRATPGATVSPAEVLFRIVDTRELWIVARLPEQDAARFVADRDAALRIAGLAHFTPLDLTGDNATASLVTIGRTVDPASRTVEVIYALRQPDPALRVGGLVTVSLPVGDPVTSLLVPRDAVLDQDGRAVVYVQVDGEHFAERGVLLAARAGDDVAIARGLQAGERIVVRGAHVVRLADRSKGGEAHGHVH